MPERHIVLLSDGTGNSRGKISTTNVWRVYEALDLADPANPDTPRQFAFYDDGVGTSSFKPLALLGGAVGYGLARNVRDLYGFLCRTYRPGDRIYAFGFSRGAFTIRVLCGLIVNQGIVRYSGDEAELLRLVKAAYRAYRRRYRLTFNYIGPIRDLRDMLINGWARLRGKKTYAESEKTGGPDSATPVAIEFLGLWDTVAAYGLPVDELSTVLDKVVWPAQMPDLKLNPRVKRAVHALALDDERNTFHPRLWAAEAGPRISQVWFAGVHSDVGGGYPDQGLSHVSLEWVITAADACKLRFVERVREQQRALSDENGPMNDSRRGIAGYYRYNPRRLEQLLAPTGNGTPVVHESVMRRIREGQDAYAPIVLPKDFEVMRFDGTRASGADYLGVSNEGMVLYAAGRERAFNRVWCKRVLYFATLFFTAALLALPLLGDKGTGACVSAWCGLSPLIRAIDAVVPAMFERWTQWYALNPGLFLSLAVPVAAGMIGSSILQRSIGDAMRRVWHSIPATRPSSLNTVPAHRPAGFIERAVQWLRTRPIYQAGFSALKHVVLPTVFGAALLYGVVVLGTVMSFALQASSGEVCKGSKLGTVVGTAGHEVRLDTTEMCKGTGLLLQAGGTYRVVLSPVPAKGHTNVWKDSSVDADLRGVRPHQVRWPMVLGTPLRREFSQPWLLPMARIGETGADLYPLKPDPSVPIDPPLTTLELRLVARSSGELFLYVNDAIGPPYKRDLFYANNEGHAQVTVVLEPPAADPTPAGAPPAEGKESSK